MAALTQSAVEALLGLLATAIKDEARLIGGVPGDMQFIKDEMDSMNGFLLHLTKMEGAHNDQVRAWMKQVREIAYMSEDCVEHYVQDIAPRLIGGDRHGFRRLKMIGLLFWRPFTFWEVHRLGNQLAELKLRVREVGERRHRYDVSVPAGRDLTKPVLKSPAAAQAEDEKREEFRRTLEEIDLDERQGRVWPAALSLSTAIDKLPVPVPAVEVEEIELDDGDVVGAPQPQREEGRGWPAALSTAIDKLPVPAGHVRSEDDDATTRARTKIIRGILDKCWPDTAAPPGDQVAALRCIKMFLCALHAHPYTTSQELKGLDGKLEQKGAHASEANCEQVMIFCYSLLSTQHKSCLQYLTAFLHETEISRTSMIRRWVAEGLLGKEQAGGGSGKTTLEEAGERCFTELVLRGFVRPHHFSDTGTVKSCVMEEPIKGFICSITESENFVLELPAHLERQLRIRQIVQGRRSLPPPPLLDWNWRKRNAVRRRCCNLCSSTSATPREPDEEDASKAPMDQLLDFLDALPALYRLNVLDLGGCRGLKSRHLKGFGKLVWLKYLSLRNTDVRRLVAGYINNLTLLETLDIRETDIQHGDTKKIYLPKLKHLLAGRRRDLVTVQIPDEIGRMKNMETLSHVQVSRDGSELEGLVRLRSRQQLRKLGVVVHGNQSTAVYLGRVLYELAGCLRSLSIWVGAGDQMALDLSSMASESTLVLENLDIKGKISSIPPWIARAQKLANVTLCDTELSGGDALKRLANVLGLRCLKLSREAFTEPALVFKDDVQFKELRFLVIDGSDAITCVSFLAAGAAPKLEKIVWAIGGISSRMMKTRSNEGELSLISGINYLPKLKGD